MAESFKRCPICNTPNHANAAVCTTCGTDLSDVEAVSRRQRAPRPRDVAYDFRYGETDLLEASVSRPAQIFAGITLVIVMALLGGVVYWAVQSDILARTNPVSTGDDAVPAPLVTNTPDNSSPMPTVTSGMPTATASSTPTATFTPSVTPTRGPCTITIPAGQTLTWALGQCGHRSLDVQQAVLDLNQLSDPAQIRAGQELLIPWPTPTTDPNAAETTEEPAADGDANAGTTLNIADNSTTGATEVLDVDESIRAFADTPTPTLPAGIQWHVIQPDQNISTLINQYSTDVKTLSELNREVDFARCDFGMTFGGPECIVQLFIGQRLRVPAPTPTPTLSPTPDPNATATPTATPTYNEPNIVSPADQSYFSREELVTLRWVPSGTLSQNEAYRVDVTDVTTGESFRALTQNISFLVPPDWQGGDNTRHEYEWTVGIVQQDNPEEIRFQTEPARFVWQGQTESDTE